MLGNAQAEQSDGKCNREQSADSGCSGLVSDHPEMFDGVLFGAAALMHVEAAFTAHVLGRWGTGQSSLRPADSGNAFGAICTETVPRRLERGGVRSSSAPIRVSTGTDVP